MNSILIKTIIKSIGHDTFIKYYEIFKSKGNLTAEDVANNTHIEVFNAIKRKNKLEDALKMAKECKNFNKEIKDV